LDSHQKEKTKESIIKGFIPGMSIDFLSPFPSFPIDNLSQPLNIESVFSPPIPCEDKMSRILVLLFILFRPSTAVADPIDLGYYLPGETPLNPEMPTPEAFFGFQIGEWHLRHDLTVAYMKELAARSDRISVQTYARSHEQRELLLLTITSPENHNNIQSIQQQHAQLTDPNRSASLNPDTMPVVVYMGYSIHGNEPSGGNAAPLVAYYLAAAQGASIDSLLQNTVILLDPAFNPDGFNRFAHWANTHRGKHPNPDPAHREHNEVWPGGRTNHYWFDLNRDWLFLQQPESQGRVAQFHAWKPNILTDHHEMATNRTFFFQPGIPSRNHPLTPDRTYELTAAITKYHAEALDSIQSLYYTKESYDDFYIGKGATYPDLNGGVGILFEQASSRGHIQDSIHGPLSFPFTIRNQVLASLSTLKAATQVRKQLLEHQRTFYTEATQEAGKSRIKAYVFGHPADLARTHHFIRLLQQHQIQIHDLARPLSPSGQIFSPGSAYVIPTQQPQYRLLTAMFERRTSFQDSLFYDVSAWTLPLAFNMPFAELTASSQEVMGDPIQPGPTPQGRIIGPQNAYAYTFEWKGYYAPRALYRLQQAGVLAKVATQPFRLQTSEGSHPFDYGSIIIPTGIQHISAQSLRSLLYTCTQEDALDVYAIETGLAISGMSLGSPSFAALETPDIAILVGEGTNAYNAGEAWHLLDRTYDMKVSLVDVRHITPSVLGNYNTILMSGGSYSTLDSTKFGALKRWIRSGNTLIAYDAAAAWAARKKLVNASIVQDETLKTKDRKPYSSVDNDQGAQVMGGAIFQVKVDRTHPLAYGYENSTLPVFRRGGSFLETTKNQYSTPLVYTQRPLLSGYISDKNLAKLKGSAAAIAGEQGSGRVILLTDNPTFRAYWYGTQKILANALFFGASINNKTLQSED
jgi:hypothetical protein